MAAHRYRCGALAVSTAIGRRVGVWGVLLTLALGSATHTAGQSVSAATGQPSLNVISTPLEGYLPQVGLGLTDRFKDENEPNFYQADRSNAPEGNWLSSNGSPHFEIALLDTGAQVVLLTAEARQNFDLVGNGFAGTETIAIGGASGQLLATIENPLGVYAGGLGNRTSTTGPLMMNSAAMRGMTSFSAVSAPAESALPNVLGLPVISQFATAIRVDQPQIFTHDGKTVRTPQITFDTLGSGDVGIRTSPTQVIQRAPLTLRPSDSFLSPPFYLFNPLNILDELPLTQNPMTPSIIQGAMFLDVDVMNQGHVRNGMSFLFDTGASVSVVSEIVADQLGFDVQVDTPDFFVNVLGSGGVLSQVPGFIADRLELGVTGGDFVLEDVPLVVLDVTDPGSPGNIVPGIIGTNLFVDRNLVIDPKPSAGAGGVGPSLYISGPVTTSRQWGTAAASGNWQTAGNWQSPGTPGSLWQVELTNAAPVDQTVVVSADSTIHRLEIHGSATADIELQVGNGASLTLFSTLTVEDRGALTIQANAEVDAQLTEQAGGIIQGSGTLHGDLLQRGGIVAPGLAASPAAGSLAAMMGNGSLSTVQKNSQAIPEPSSAGLLVVLMACLVSGRQRVRLAR